MAGCFERFFSSSARDLKSWSLYRALLAEMLGTMLLVFVATASVASTNDLVGISLCFGLAVASVVWALGNASGGHVNPAVSFGMLAARKISLARCLLYVAAQCLGAVIGSAATQTLSCSWQSAAAAATSAHSTKCVLGVTELGRGVSATQGFAIEMLITFVLVFVVFATCDASRTDLHGSGHLAIGLSVTLCHLAAIPLTGSSMNTARSFGPAVIADSWTDHWVYWAGPISGGIMAALLYDLVFAGDASLLKFADWLAKADYCRPDGGRSRRRKPMDKHQSRDVLPPIAHRKKYLGSDAELHLMPLTGGTDFIETRA